MCTLSTLYRTNRNPLGDGNPQSKQFLEVRDWFQLTEYCCQCVCNEYSPMKDLDLR